LVSRPALEHAAQQPERGGGIERENAEKEGGGRP